MTKTINKNFTAYCSLENDEKTIKVEVICHENLGGFVSYGITNFQCVQMAKCPFVNRNGECSFTDEVIRQIHSRRNNF